MKKNQLILGWLVIACTLVLTPSHALAKQGKCHKSSINDAIVYNL